MTASTSQRRYQISSRKAWLRRCTVSSFKALAQRQNPKASSQSRQVLANTALNGALANYSKLIEARKGIKTANAGPITAIVMHPRDYGPLAGLTATDNQPLLMPPALNGIRMLQTSALQIDAGSGNNESNIVVGNFNHCLIGMRHDIRIEVLRELYANTHQFGFVAVMRFDVALSDAEAFHKISGITP
jgi:HK97 family phage major capsid protein